MLRRYRGAYGLLKLHTVHRPDDDDYTMIEMDEKKWTDGRKTTNESESIS